MQVRTDRRHGLNTAALTHLRSGEDAGNDDVLGHMRLRNSGVGSEKDPESFAAAVYSERHHRYCLVHFHEERMVVCLSAFTPSARTKQTRVAALSCQRRS